MMECRHLNLHPLDAIATEEADLGVTILLPLGLAELESDQPFNL